MIHTKVVSLSDTYPAYKAVRDFKRETPKSRDSIYILITESICLLYSGNYSVLLIESGTKLFNGYDVLMNVTDEECISVLMHDPSSIYVEPNFIFTFSKDKVGEDSKECKFLHDWYWNMEVTTKN